MAIRGARSSLVPAVVVRLVLAVALTAGAFLALYVGGQGTCMTPDSLLGLVVLVAYAAPFLIGFVWLMSEVASLSFPGWPRSLTVLVGLLTYAAIGAGFWIADPATAVKDNPGTEFRLVMSVDWSAGILLEAGAFSDYSCGY